MTGLDTITSDQLEGLLLDIWMSGFKSGAVSTLANLEMISQFIHARLGITCGCGQHRTGG